MEDSLASQTAPEARLILSSCMTHWPPEGALAGFIMKYSANGPAHLGGVSGHSV